MDARKIIFLDFDGVMNTGKYDLYLNQHNLPEKDEFGVVFDSDCINALKHIIEETKAEIVISSSWKDYLNIEEIKQMWAQRNLPGVPIDVTPSISIHHGDEIDAWLNRRPVTCHYVIIDDQSYEEFHNYQYPHLVTTNNFNGLTMSLAQKAINILNS